MASGDSTPRAMGLDSRSCWTWSLIIGLPRKTLLHRSENDGDIRSSPASCDIANTSRKFGDFRKTGLDPVGAYGFRLVIACWKTGIQLVLERSLRNLDGLRRGLTSRGGQGL